MTLFSAVLTAADVGGWDAARRQLLRASVIDKAVLRPPPHRVSRMWKRKKYLEYLEYGTIAITSLGFVLYLEMPNPRQQGPPCMRCSHKLLNWHKRCKRNIHPIHHHYRATVSSETKSLRARVGLNAHIVMDDTTDQSRRHRVQVAPTLFETWKTF